MLFDRRSAACLVTLLLALTPAVGDDWPQWRGVHRDGRSAETDLLQQWPEGGPPLAWKASGIGAGFASVSVAGGRIFVLGDVNGAQYAFALKEDGGGQLWKVRVGKAHDDEYGGPRSTPTVAGDRVYVMTTEGHVVCLEAATGKERWRRSLPEDFGGALMKAKGTYDWKFTESPLVDGNRVIVTPGHADAMIVALEATTGEEIWRTPATSLGERGENGAAYASAVISEAAGIRQYVQLVGRGVVGVEADTGKLLWGYNRVANNIANIATPLVQGDRVFASTGYGTGAALLHIRKGESGLQSEEVYFVEAHTMQNHHGGLILHDGFVFTGTGHNKGFPLALRLDTGKVAWGPERTEGKGSSAIAYADGRLYFRFEDGRMILVEATGQGYREHGTFVIPEVRKQSWSHPVIANGKLLLREQDNLYAYDVKARPAETAGKERVSGR